MQECKDDSLRFSRNTARNSSGSSTRSNGQEHCRKKLKDKFDECEKQKSKENPENNDCSRSMAERTVLSMLNLNETRKYIRSGAERLSKTFNSVRVTFGSFSQGLRGNRVNSLVGHDGIRNNQKRFKTVTKRRQILEEGPMTPIAQTPYTKSRQVLGRTPTKLYSPFGIDSPYHPTTTIDKENYPVSMALVKQ